MFETILLTVLIFAAAVLYSSVGHGGASAYLAAMALMSVAPEVMKPTALCLNILVAGIGTVRFYRAGCFSMRTFWPFAITSIPLAFLGGSLGLPAAIFKRLLGLVLVFAAVRMTVLNFKSAPAPTITRPPLPAALLAGGGIGLLSGLTGTGGGIFLSPLLLLMRWADVRVTAGVSAAFVLLNSAAGLAGNVLSVRSLLPSILYWGPAAVLGGILGSGLGSRRFAQTTLRYLLSGVLVIAAAKLIFA